MKNTGTDCAVESNRKPNTDYTIVAKSDDDKKQTSEKSNTTATVANLFVDNTRNKRDKSPTTICQHNGDTTIANDNIADNSRVNSTENNSVNKKCDNQHNGGGSAAQTEMNAATKRHQKTICYDFKKGMCRRRFCRVSYSCYAVAPRIRQLYSYVSISHSKSAEEY